MRLLASGDRGSCPRLDLEVACTHYWKGDSDCLFSEPGARALGPEQQEREMGVLLRAPISILRALRLRRDSDPGPSHATVMLYPAELRSRAHRTPHTNPVPRSEA